MAHIRRLPSGNYSAEVRLPNGKRTSITDPLKRAVKQRAEELEASIRRGDTRPRDRRLTVAGWHADWAGTRRVETATAKKNESHWRNHVQPHWGEALLATIRRSHVQRWVIDMEKAGVGAPTIHAAYNLLAAMLTDAVLEGSLAASPCREIDLPRITKPAPRWLTREEYGRVQLALAETDRAPVWRALIGLGCYSGLRVLGELAGLDVEHIDFDRGLVYVQQVQTRSGLRAYPKNDASFRWVPFPPEVGDMLWRIVGDRGQGPVFTAPGGGRVNESNFRNRIWRPALTKAGVGYEAPYVMRHTAASWLIQAGVPDYEVARMLGHSSTRMLGVYAHLAPDRHDRIRAAWGSAAETDAVRMPYAGQEESPRPSGRGL
jgi:integrase